MDRPDNAPSYSLAVAEEEAFAAETVLAPATASAPRTRFASEVVPAPAPWHPLTRVGFRIAFIYFICFMWLYGNDGADFNAIVIWRGLSNFLSWPLNQVLLWTGAHIYHVKNMPPHWHVADRGDALGNWVMNQVIVVASLLGGLVWTAVAWLRGSTRTEYRTLLAWLRFFLRLTVGFFMIAYGMLKVFPLQMPPVSLGILAQPAGDMSPHALLWTMVGVFPLYEFICGLAETVAGTMVLFRRTALAGTLLSIFLMSNVVLYNMFFGVTVKLFAINLLLAEIFILLPDVRPMIDFFWRHMSAAQTGVWTPPLARRGVRIYVRALEVIFIVASLTWNPLFDGADWYHQHVMARTQSPLRGAWRLDSTHPASGPFVLHSGPATEFYVDTVERAMTRSANGNLWRTYLKVDPTAHTIKISPFIGNDETYKWQMPDANHLVLTSTPPEQSRAKKAPAVAPEVVTLTRISIPAQWPLYANKFKIVSYY